MISKNHKEKIQTMFENSTKKVKPKVGIFWYDVQQHCLFGVESETAENIPFNQNGFKTTYELHRDVWQTGLDPRFEGDYTQVPRGRVFEVKGKGFEVNVGNWIEAYPEVKDLILLQFRLPEEETEFVVDSHWDLGHGWSDEFLT